MKKSWKKMWTDHFERKYAAAVARWDGKFDDDRLVFCNTYRMIVRALDSLSDDPDTLVKCAMNSAFEKEQKSLDAILGYFENR